MHIFILVKHHLLACESQVNVLQDILIALHLHSTVYTKRTIGWVSESLFPPELVSETPQYQVKTVTFHFLNALAVVITLPKTAEGKNYINVGRYLKDHTRLTFIEIIKNI